MIDSPNLTYVNAHDESGGIFFMQPCCLIPDEDIYYTNDAWQFWKTRRKDKINYWERNRFIVY